MTEEQDHLPLYGPGPAYVITIVALTAAGIVLSALGILPVASAGGAAIPLRVLGIALIVGGVALWAGANFGARIDDGIMENVNKELTVGDDYVDFEVKLHPTSDFLAQILSRGRWLKVLEPEDIALKIRRMHLEAAEE